MSNSDIDLRSLNLKALSLSTFSTKAEAASSGLPGKPMRAANRFCRFWVVGEIVSWTEQKKIILAAKNAMGTIEIEHPGYWVGEYNVNWDGSIWTKKQ